MLREVARRLGGIARCQELRKHEELRERCGYRHQHPANTGQQGGRAEGQPTWSRAVIRRRHGFAPFKAADRRERQLTSTLTQAIRLAAPVTGVYFRMLLIGYLEGIG